MMTQLGKLEALYPQRLIDRLTKDFLKTKRKIKINNEEFLILNTCFLILYLSLHLFHHNFTGAFRYDFLDKVIRKNKLSINKWKDIALIINKYQLQNFIYPVFFFLKKYYQTLIPKNFLNQIKPNFYTIFTLLFTQHLHKINIFNDEPRLKAGIKRFYIFLFYPPLLFGKKY